MGQLDENGIYIYDEDDPIAPIHTTLNLGMASTSATISDIHSHSLIKPVANASERSAYETEMRNAGFPPSLERPLWVEMQSDGAVYRNRGAGWHRMIDNSLDRHNFTGTSGGVERDSYVIKKNGWVSLVIREKRFAANWSGDREIMGPNSGGGVIPARFRPTSNVFGVGFVYLRNDIHKPFSIIVFPNGTVMGYDMRLQTGNWYSATISWPTND